MRHASLLQCGPGTAATAAQATAGADGTAAATLRFVVSQSERACPAGPSLPWYVESGEWRLQVADEQRGLLVTGVDVSTFCKLCGECIAVCPETLFKEVPFEDRWEEVLAS